MRGYPGFGSAGERAAYLLARHRLAEIPFAELTPEELRGVTSTLHRRLVRARLRALAAHVGAMVLAVGFLALGALLLGVGPMIHITSFPVMSDVTAPTEGALWLLLLAISTFGLVTADYLLRRRRRITESYDREVSSIRHALEHAANRG